MSIPKTPVEFDYDLWTTEEGKCMVRIKATGEITEVERSALRGEASPAHHISGAGSIQRRENRSNGSLSGYASRRCGRLQLVS